MAREIETKLFLGSLKIEELEEKLMRLGFVRQLERQHEHNLVFDDSRQSLKEKGMLLRLRKYGEQATLTLKKPLPNSIVGIKSREENEIEVSDFFNTQKILETLGFSIRFEYEKYRAVYRRAQAAAMIDETPLGLFLEIEADEGEISLIVDELGFSWDQCIADSYQSLWKRKYPDRPMLFSR